MKLGLESPNRRVLDGRPPQNASSSEWDLFPGHPRAGALASDFPRSIISPQARKAGKMRIRRYKSETVPRNDES